MEIEKLYTLFTDAKKVCTDTRTIIKDSLFFALKGTTFNGNQFAAKALEQGAAYAIIDEAEFLLNDRYILVDDVLTCLQQLAHFHRKQFSIPFLAITGSNGKTTTKELINAVLSSRFKTVSTKGNLNNHIGIPLTLLSIPIGTEIAVIEMGANHQKEIEHYCTYVEPTHGLITNIGKAHLEGFGGIEGVKKGKGELYVYLQNTNGKVFINTNDLTLNELVKQNQIITYPTKNDFSYCELLEATPFIHYKTNETSLVKTNLTGQYNFNNLAAAYCIGKYFSVEEHLIHKALSEYIPDNNRSQFSHVGSNELLLDAYNANPSSMAAALENFNALNKKNKCVILGDMFELGDESEKEHAALGEYLNTTSFQTILLCGRQMRFAAKKASKAHYFETKSALETFLQQSKINQSTILIKGSRGMGLEQLLPFLTT